MIGSKQNRMLYCAVLLALTAAAGMLAAIMYRPDTALPEEPDPADGQQETLDMPYLTDMTWEEAARYAEHFGLIPQRELAEHPDTMRGWVYAQFPEEGIPVAPGSTVYFSVAADTFFFRYTPPAQAEGSFAVILYDANGTESARDVLELTPSAEPETRFLRGLKTAPTCSFQAVLENTESGESCSIGSYATDYTAAADADPEKLTFAFSYLGGLPANPAETKPTATTPAVTEPPESEQTWQRLYADYLTEAQSTVLSYLNASSLKFDLVYIDEDDIPELVVAGVETTDCTVMLFTVYDGALYEVTPGIMDGSFAYLERQNRLFTMWKNSRYTGHLISCLEEGETKTVTSFRETWTQTKGYAYRLDTKTLDKAEYDSELERLFEVPEKVQWKYADCGRPLNEANIRKYLT